MKEILSDIVEENIVWGTRADVSKLAPSMNTFWIAQ